MVTELAGIGCRGEVAGKKSDYDRNPATEFPSSCSYVNKALHLD